jgi:hypothetical protein
MEASALNVLHDFRQGCAATRNFSPERPTISGSHHFPIEFSKSGIILTTNSTRTRVLDGALLSGVRAASGMATSSLL